MNGYKDFPYSLVKPTGLDTGDVQAVQGVVAHENEVVQMEDAGVAEISIRGAGNDSLVFPRFPFIAAP